MFQSTRPRGRTRPPVSRVVAVQNVSIHASSREDATKTAEIIPRFTGFQSTRPRGRTRLYLRGIIAKFTVSIHASSREDATRVPLICLLKEVFQSTRPRGRTRHNLIYNEPSTDVSIHASSREDATSAPFGIPKLKCFNPRVLAGGRDGECRKQYKSKCYICKSAKEIILIINEEQYHFS